ncbi:acyl-CoA synthetase [Microbacterium mangrovi]|uniref:Acyl-CoA synthetase n=1 Tax=Microbacterium mangrovi TaxID=1348253 RepID=A0A0B2A3B1_9MICO|nr:AMP-binding protein [Microbacterium mangrovi]KHK97984.1 acyl-CoA synthetase [Microbacterium mangrovi]
MPASLVALGADDPDAVIAALRRMLDGTGPALALGGGPATGGDSVPDGTGVVVTTSGSTGVPKSVVLSRAALDASATATAARIGEGAWMLALPSGYIAGLQVALRSLRAGFDPVPLTGHFTPEAFRDATARLPAGAPRYTSFVPAQLRTLLDDPDPATTAALGSYAAVLVGGQALPKPLRERAADAGIRIVRTYGSTETCGGCVYDGVPLDGVGVRIEDGEVQLTGPMLADGYLGDARRTADVFPTGADGTRWYRTGDAGSFENGVLAITGRLDNVIVSGGVNVSLDRVERAVREVPGFAGAVVVGVPDDRWGEASVVVVARADADGGAADLQRVRDAVAAAAGAPARPRELVVVDRLPQLTSGKPDRRAIRETALIRATQFHAS